MSGVQKIILIGNLGKDPETTKFDNGNKVVRFSLAVGESYKNKQGEKVENTEWFNIEIFGKLGDVAERYLTKGSKVYVEGKQRTSRWEKEDGQKMTSTSITVNSLTMLGDNDRREQDEHVNKETGEVIGSGELDDFPF